MISTTAQDREAVAAAIVKLRGVLEAGPVSADALAATSAAINSMHASWDATSYARRDEMLGAMYLCATFFSIVLLLFLQTGMGMWQQGVVRAKNMRQTLHKHLFVAIIIALCFKILGYQIAYELFSPLYDDDKKWQPPGGDTSGLYENIHFMYNFFCVVMVAGIVSGAMAERGRLETELGLFAMLVTFTVPAAMHCVWDRGFLSPHAADPMFGVGLLDYAGAGVLHVVGGTAALIAAALLGPRLDESGRPRFSKDCTPTDFEGRTNAVFPCLGVHIMWFAWYGFVWGGSLRPGEVLPSATASLVTVNITLGGAAGLAVTSFVMMLLELYYISVVRPQEDAVQDPEGPPGPAKRTMNKIYRFNYNRCLNGVLAGLVAINACSAVVTPWLAAFTGGMGGLLYFAASCALEHLKIDDPMDSSAVHLTCGLWSLLSVALFADQDRVASYYDNPENPVRTGLRVGGVLMEGGSGDLLGAQVCGALAIVAWTALTCLLYFAVLHLPMLWGGSPVFRAQRSDEIRGLGAVKGGTFFPTYLWTMIEELEALNSSHPTAIDAMDQSFLDFPDPVRNMFFGETSSHDGEVSSGTYMQRQMLGNARAQNHYQAEFNERQLEISSNRQQVEGTPQGVVVGARRPRRVSMDNSSNHSTSNAISAGRPSFTEAAASNPSTEGMAPHLSPTGSFSGSGVAMDNPMVVRRLSIRSQMQRALSLTTKTAEGISKSFRSKTASEDTTNRPLLRFAVEEQVLKGEDFYKVVPMRKATHPDASVSADGDLEGPEGTGVSYGYFSVMDGHNGRMCGAAAENMLLKHVMTAMPAWRNEDDFVRALPDAIVKGYRTYDADFASTGQMSGCTATSVFLNGWTVTAGNVGDSSCFVDSGKEILQLTADHRIATNPDELNRLLLGGQRVQRLRLRGRLVGPLRAWPGGLCLARSLGDADVGPNILAVPQVSSVKLPTQGGRIIVASDGLWDSVENPEQAIMAVRNKHTKDAAALLAQMAVKQRGLCDDLTIVVVDVLPRSLGAKKDGRGSLFRRKYNEIMKTPNLFGYTLDRFGLSSLTNIQEMTVHRVPDHVHLAESAHGPPAGRPMEFHPPNLNNQN